MTFEIWRDILLNLFFEIICYRDKNNVEEEEVHVTALKISAVQQSLTIVKVFVTTEKPC